MKKILVCDDDKGILEVLRIILENNDYEVETVSNGRGIEKKVKAYKPDLILLDIWMPGIEGKEITKLLKRDRATGNIPLVIISALNDTDKIAREVGADDFLVKPFDINVLLDKVKKYT